MAHPTNVKAAWTKPGFRVALVGAIDAATSTTMEHILLDTNTDAIWPHPSKELTHHGISANGAPFRTAQDVTLGRVEPSFTVECPLTTRSLLILGGSLLQDENHDGSTGYSMQVYDAAAKSIADMYMNCEAGIAGAATAVYKVQGAIVRTLRVTAPPVGPDLGKVMLSAEIIAANSTPATAYTAGSPTLDPGTPQLSSGYAMTLNINGAGSATFEHVSFDLTATNNAEKGLNAGATPDHMSLGEFSATGNISVVFTSAADASDGFYAMDQAHQNKHTTEILLSIGSHHNFLMDALIGKPTMSRQGNVFVAQFPIEAVYVDANSFRIGVDSVSDVVNWGT